MEITLSSGLLRIFSFYSPPRKDLKLSRIRHFFDTATPTILAGDLNAKHIAWGCRVTNPKGHSLFKNAQKHNFTIEAPSQPTHFPGNPNYLPDILDIFVTRNVRIIEDPKVMDELSSDHLPVLLKIPCSYDVSPPTEKIIDWLELDYYLETSSFKCTPLKTTADIDRAVELLTSDIQVATQKATKETPSKSSQLYLPPHILQLIQLKNRTRSQWQKYGNPSIKAELNAQIRRLRSLISEFRSQSFNKFIEEAEAHPKSTWKVIRSLRNRKAQLPPLKVDGKDHYFDEDRANVLVKSLRVQCSLKFAYKPVNIKFQTEINVLAFIFKPTNSAFKPTFLSEV